MSRYEWKFLPDEDIDSIDLWILFDRVEREPLGKVRIYKDKHKVKGVFYPEIGDNKENTFGWGEGVVESAKRWIEKQYLMENYQEYINSIGELVKSNPDMVKLMVAILNNKEWK